jgi:dienelactone hydrolase
MDSRWRTKAGATAVVADVAAAQRLTRRLANGVGGAAMFGCSLGGHIGLLATSHVPFDLPHGSACPDRPKTYDTQATADVWRRVFRALAQRVNQAR